MSDTLSENYSKLNKRYQEIKNQLADLEAKLEEKDREINYVYPFLKEYDNGVFTEYNVVYERDGIVATTCFGKNKGMAYEYLKTLRNDIKVASQNQKAIEELEKVKEFTEKEIKECNKLLQEEFEDDYDIQWVNARQSMCYEFRREIDNQINELKGNVEE